MSKINGCALFCYVGKIKILLRHSVSVRCYIILGNRIQFLEFLWVTASEEEKKLFWFTEMI